MKIRIYLCLLFGFLALSTHGAEPPGIDPATGMPFRVPPPGGLFDLNFRGGTANELVIAMQDAGGKKPNLLLSPGAEKIILPPLQLREVTISQVFDALSRLMRSERVIFIATAAAPGGAPIWTMHRDNPQTSRICKVFYVGDLLQKYKIDDITTAIQSVWKMEGAEGELKFHQDTQLLIACAAQPERLRTISEILAELKSGTSGAKSEPGGTPTEREKKGARE